jgi:hypothetical protein
MEWIPCTECIYVNEDCVEARRADGCYCGEREESLKETDGFDYYIEDELGGVHTDGVGYAPDGSFCGECTKESCEGCPAWKKEN